MLNDLQKNTGVKVIVVGAVANLVLAMLKIAAGIVGRSTAMVADGIHSLSDLLTDGVCCSRTRSADSRRTKTTLTATGGRRPWAPLWWGR